MLYVMGPKSLYLWPDRWCDFWSIYVDFVTRSATGFPRWERTDTFKSCTAKNWVMLCVFFCVWGYGSTASWPACTAPPGPLGQTRLGGSDSAQSKVNNLFIHCVALTYKIDIPRCTIFTFSNSWYFAGYVVFRIRVRRGGRKRPVAKGATYGKPKSHGVNQLKPTRNLQSIAEVSVCVNFSRIITIWDSPYVVKCTL